MLNKINFDAKKIFQKRNAKPPIYIYYYIKKMLIQIYIKPFNYFFFWGGEMILWNHVILYRKTNT